MARRGRRPGAPRTREAILAAARDSFARLGYDRATIRAIAGAAGVDPALVLHYFPSKEHVFAAVMELPFDAEAVVRRVLEGPPDGLGERLVRTFIATWEDPVAGPGMVGLLRSAASYEVAAERLRELIGARLMRPLAAALAVPDPELRAELAGAQLVGFAFMRYVLRVEPIASADSEVLVAAFAPTVQRYLTADRLERDAALPTA